MAPRSPLRGIWRVEEFEADGQVLPQVAGDAARWRRAIFDSESVFAIQLMNDSRQRFKLKLDNKKKTLALSKVFDPSWRATLSFSRPDADGLELEGTMEGRKLRVKLRLEPEPEFLLMTREFQWINEFPFNR